MTKLTSKSRNKIPNSEFGLPSERKYPISDKSHAANAKARATQMVKKGKLSMASKAKIDKKADRMLSGSDYKDQQMRMQAMKHAKKDMSMKKVKAVNKKSDSSKSAKMTPMKKMKATKAKKGASAQSMSPPKIKANCM